MKYSDQDIISRMGLDILEDEVREQMLISFYQTLDQRVSMVVASKLSEEQLSRFAELEKTDESAAADLLKSIPDYEKILDSEADKLLQEIDDNAAEVVKDL